MASVTMSSGRPFDDMLNFDGVSAPTRDRYLDIQNKLRELDTRIDELQKQPPAVRFTDLLDDSQVPEEVNIPLVRKYMVLTYNKLKKENSLDVLKLPDDDIYVYEGGDSCLAHEKIFQLASAYLNEIRLGDFHYGTVISYLKALYQGDYVDRNNLSIFILHQRKQELEWFFNFTKGRIRSEHDTYIQSLSLTTKTTKDFSRGDFTFIPELMTRNMLQHAFEAIENAGLWSHFDRIREDFALRDCNADIDLKTKVINVIAKQDGLTGNMTAFTMKSMLILKTMGWENYVGECLKSIQEIAKR